MIAAERPFSMASVKKEAVMISRLGSPKETLEIPSEVRQPRSFEMRRRAARVVRADCWSALTVIARVSKIRSFFGIPYSAATSMMRCAIATLLSGSAGIPSSSRVRQTTRPPYFLTSGKISRMTSSLPLTELIIALPLYRRMAFSMAVVFVVSIWSGRSMIAWSSKQISGSISVSSISGMPTLTSRTCAPLSCCFSPSPRT